MLLRDVRRFAIARSLLQPTTLKRAIDALGFVQADPIRAPARAQDLALRHRVAGYRAGDLERLYPTLDIEEDAFINYGFLPRAHQALMHPRVTPGAWAGAGKQRARAVLEFVREHGEVHPRQVEAHLGHGAVRNYWGGSSNATTHLLDGLHYRGLLRVTRRESGVRVYGVREQTPPPANLSARRAQLDALVDIVVRKYAPLPSTSLNPVVRRLRYGAPQLRGGLDAALARAKRRLVRARIDGIDWYWPEHEAPKQNNEAIDEQVRLLSPFDPIVWDRVRFELLWGWAYRFEAYTPVQKRKLGYYALPLLWHDRVIGWANLAVNDRVLVSDFGYVSGRAPRGPAFKRELDNELNRMRSFLGLRADAVNLRDPH